MHISYSLLSSCCKEDNPLSLWPRRGEKVATRPGNIQCGSHKSPLLITRKVIRGAGIQRSHSERGYWSLVMASHTEPDGSTTMQLTTAQSDCTCIIGRCQEIDLLVPANFRGLSMFEAR